MSDHATTEVPPATGGHEADDEARDQISGSSGKGKRQRSTIAFPYGDLEDAVAVARVVWNHGGQCDLNQLAAALDHGTSTSGAFRIKVGAAKTFGLITGNGASLRLTSLGRRIVDDQGADAARVEAFLHVPLYQRIFDEVSTAGGALPEDAGLEDMIKRFGVVTTQADRARQAFQRSARQAGFNQHGPRRLVKPAVGTMGTPTESPEAEVQADTAKRPGGDDIGMKPALITELFRQLPDEGEPFPRETRKLWEAVLQGALNLMYGKDEEATQNQANGQS